MQKKRVLSLILALSCTAALLGGCAGNDTSDDTTASGEHEVITMNAPYRNMSQFYDLVHEKYPEINLEIIPYNGENTSSYMKDMRLSFELPDIYCTTYYTPGRMDDEGDFLDLSGYDFMDNYTPSRLRDVSYNGGIYMLPMGYGPTQHAHRCNLHLPRRRRHAGQRLFQRAAELHRRHLRGQYGRGRVRRGPDPRSVSAARPQPLYQHVTQILGIQKGS